MASHFVWKWWFFLYLGASQVWIHRQHCHLLCYLDKHSDFGTWRSSILIIHTLVAVAIGFAWLDVYSPDKWQFAVVLYIIGSE